MKQSIRKPAVVGKAQAEITMRDAAGEVAVPGYVALAADGALSQRIADILVCNVSTRKYARVVHRCAAELGISKSAVSRQFVKQSAQALAELRSRRFDEAALPGPFSDTNRRLSMNSPVGSLRYAARDNKLS